jgi:hypothetical protein
MVWPHALSESRVALASAALRHTADAAALAATSPVQAYHLAGFGPECARKAALTFTSKQEEDEMYKAVGHGFKKDAEAALAVACALDPLASRYALRDWKARAPHVAGWDPQCRYEKSDHFTVRQAEELVGEASALVEDVVVALWADGRLPPLGELVRVRP